MLMKNVNGINMPLDEADLAQREADAQMVAVQAMPDITRRQLRLALLQLGITAQQVEAEIATMPGTPIKREAAMIEWCDSLTYRRDHWLVEVLGSALGMTEAQIDAAWMEAAKI